MPSGVERLRMSKINHPMPIMAWGTDDQGDLSGLRGTQYRDGTVLREYKDSPSAPRKTRPFASSKGKSEIVSPGVKTGTSQFFLTGPPREAEHSVIGGTSWHPDVPDTEGKKNKAKQPRRQR